MAGGATRRPFLLGEAMAKTRSKAGRWRGKWPPETDEEWERWFRILVEGRLASIEARAKSGLAWKALDERKHAQLIAGWKGMIHTVATCRQCISKGRFWALAHYLSGMQMAEIHFLAGIGEKALEGARVGGVRKTTAARDLDLAHQYLTRKSLYPSRGKTRLIHEVANQNGLNPATGVKAINRGLSLIQK